MPHPTRILGAIVAIAITTLLVAGAARAAERDRQHALEHLLIGPERRDGAPERVARPPARSMAEWKEAERRRYERRFAQLYGFGRQGTRAAVVEDPAWAARREQQGRRDIEILRRLQPSQR